jgi:predicted nuclease of predicted toxin-antitoxin system
VKLLLDENISASHARALRAERYDAVAIVEQGLGGAADEAVRLHAIDTGRILVTLDADFANIIRFPPEGTPGVVRLRLHPPTETAIASALQRLLELLTNFEVAGKLIIVDSKRIRIRTTG